MVSDVLSRTTPVQQIIGRGIGGARLKGEILKVVTCLHYCVEPATSSAVLIHEYESEKGRNSVTIMAKTGRS